MIATHGLAPHFIGGNWQRGQSADHMDVLNPATTEVLASVPLAGAAEVDAAVSAARDAFPAWRRTPPQDRIQFLFRFKRLLMQGYNLEDVASGIDEIMIRQPLGVVAAITPFNFPAMVPLWFLPYAIACGNTFILKPSERVPLTARRIFELLHQTALPKGVVNLVVGAKPAVDALLKHPDVRAISFVGSTPVAKYVYMEGSAAGKRVQCQGGAKNHVVILPDADC